MIAVKPLRAVLVGCGGISRTWLEAIRRIADLELVGLVDVRLEAARARQIEFGLPSVVVSDSLESTLRDVRPDLVFDCTVPEAHHETALTAFRHGAHVLGEKPLADSMARAREIVDAARASGRIHAVIQNRRYDPAIRRVEHHVASGGIGRLTNLHADFFVGAHFGGFRDAMLHVLLMDMAIHTFDAARFLSAQNPVSVYCHEWNPSGSWYAHGANAIAIFEMTNDVVFSYRGSWCAEGFRTTWESDWRIVGTNGTIRWDGGTHPRGSRLLQVNGLLGDHQEYDLPVAPLEADMDGHRRNIQEMIHAVRSGVDPETVASDNIKSLAMIFAAMESAQTGQRVRVSWD